MMNMLNAGIGSAVSPLAVCSMVVGILLGSPGCRPLPVPEPEPARVLETVRLDAAEAARLAAEIRAEVSAQVEVAAGLELDLWASEPLLMDPHALSVDDGGRVYVASSGRTRTQRALSNHFADRYSELLGHRTVEEFRSYLRREVAPGKSAENQEWLPDLNGDGSHDWRDLTVEKERVYRIQDTSGDGLADLSEVIVEDFHTEITNIVGGLLVHDDDLFVGVTPGIWRLRDVSRDGIPDTRESVSHGYGVRFGFFGHGMSGITMGPDGRIYWSVGDVGVDVVDRDGARWSYPNQGTILRANPDGSDFEVFAAGVRNVYEFAFDRYGNLIAADNDAGNRGEQDRLVYLAHGSDSGWRANWERGKYSDSRNNEYKVWVEEGLNRPRFEGQPAYITPAFASYVSGPAGMAYNPGTALGEAWRDHFFVAMNTRVIAFRLREEGAGFALARDTVVLNKMLTTSMDFGSDGALYLADLVRKVKPKLGGRIWKLDGPVAAGSPLRVETQALLADDFDRRSRGDLLGLLGHADMRVRMKAQFELVERSDARTLRTAARKAEDRLARLHGLWGLGQLAREDSRRAPALVAFLGDADAEVRAQAAKVLGESEHAPAGDALVPLLRDESARVRFFAAQALGQIEHRPAVQPLIAMLAANDDEDAYLRHAGTLALARIGEVEPLVALTAHPSRAVRIAAVVALRRMRHPGVARFLADPDESVVTEAARAVNDDDSIEAALPDLAALLEEDRFASEALIRRAINANLRLGTAEAARRVAAYAGTSRAPEAMRVEAIAVLGVWPESSAFDRVDGRYRGVVERDPATARAAVASLLEPLLVRGSPAIQVALVEVIGRLNLDAAAPDLLALVGGGSSAELRIAALKALGAMGGERMEEAVRTALADRDASVRTAALAMIPELSLPEKAAAELLASVIGRGPVEAEQTAIERLGSLHSPNAQRVLSRLLEHLEADTLPAAVRLDLMEAVQESPSPALQARLERYRAARADDPLATYGAALYGGDARDGRKVVFENGAAMCTRCHLFGEPGPSVGPDLGEIGATLSREQLLQALVDPDARIAPGFGTGPSGMPPMGRILTQREIRDVVEFLSTLR